MSSLVHTVVSDVIASQERLQHQPATCPPPLHLDSNNNTGGDFVVDNDREKYAEADRVNSTINALKSGEKYSLRPRSFQRRSATEVTSTRRSARKRGSFGTESATRPKQKPPPLSKYRRKTANARERDRMREINAAFETLRRAVPHISSSSHRNQHDNSGSEKLTKITTLRLAMKYIAALSQALQQPGNFIPTLLPPTSNNSSTASCGSSISSSGIQQVISDGESLNFKEHCHTPPDFTSSGFMRQCITPPKLTPFSSSNHNRHRGTPPLENKRQSLTSSYHVHKTTRTPSQNNLSSESGATAHCVVPGSLGDLCENHPSTGLSPECLLSQALNQQCHHVSVSNSQLSLPAPVSQPPDLSHHYLTPEDFEHTNEEQSSFIVFDDESLDSPDLDHLLISWHQYAVRLPEVSAQWWLQFQDSCLRISILVKTTNHLPFHSIGKRNIF